MKEKENIENEKLYKIRVNKRNASSNISRSIGSIKEKKIKLNINKTKNINKSAHILKTKITNERSFSSAKNNYITNQIVIDKMKLINNFNISIPYRRKYQENLRRSTPNSRVNKKICNELNINNSYQINQYISLINRYRQKLISEFLKHIKKAFLFYMKLFFNNLLKNLNEKKKRNNIIKKNIMKTKQKSSNILNNNYNTIGIRNKKSNNFQKTFQDIMFEKRIKQKIISKNISRPKNSRKEEIKTKRIYNIKNKTFQNNYSMYFNNDKYNLEGMNTNSPKIGSGSNKLIHAEIIDSINNSPYENKNIYHKSFINSKNYNLSLQRNKNLSSSKIIGKKNVSLLQIINNSNNKNKFTNVFKEKNIKSIQNVKQGNKNFYRSKMIQNNKKSDEKINIRMNYFLFRVNKNKKNSKKFLLLKPQKQLQYSYYKMKKIYCKKKLNTISEEKKLKKIKSRFDKYLFEKISNFIKIINIFYIRKSKIKFLNKLKGIQKFYKYFTKFSYNIKKDNFTKICYILQNLKKIEEKSTIKTISITNNNGINNNSSNDNNNIYSDSKHKTSSYFDSVNFNNEDSNNDIMNSFIPQDSIVINQFIVDKPAVINNNDDESKDDFGFTPFNFEDLFFKIRVCLILYAFHKKNSK